MKAQRRARDRPQIQRRDPSDPERRRARRHRQVRDARQEAEPQLGAGAEAAGDRRDRLAAQHEIAERLDQLRIAAAGLGHALVAVARAEDAAVELERLVGRVAEREVAAESGVGVRRAVRALDQEPRRAEVLAVEAQAHVPGRADLGGRHVVEANRARQGRQVRVGIAFRPARAADGTGDAVASTLAAALPDVDRDPASLASGRDGSARTGTGAGGGGGGAGAGAGAAAAAGGRGGAVGCGGGGAVGRAIAGGSGSSSGAVWPKAAGGERENTCGERAGAHQGTQGAAHGPDTIRPGRRVKCPCAAACGPGRGDAPLLPSAAGRGK